MKRKCESCESIDFGIWGTLGLIGFSLIMGVFGYVVGCFISQNFYSLKNFYSFEIIPILTIAGVLLWLPMYVISIKERKKENEE